VICWCLQSENLSLQQKLTVKIKESRSWARVSFKIETTVNWFGLHIRHPQSTGQNLDWIQNFWQRLRWNLWIWTNKNENLDCMFV